MAIIRDDSVAEAEIEKNVHEAIPSAMNFLFDQKCSCDAGKYCIYRLTRKILNGEPLNENEVNCVGISLLKFYLEWCERQEMQELVLRMFEPRHPRTEH